MSALLTLPTPKLEAWKFTHLQRAVELLPPAAPASPTLQQLEACLPVMTVPQLVFQGGKRVEELCTPLPEGCVLEPLGPQLAGLQEKALDGLDELAVPQGWRLRIVATPAAPLALMHLAGGPCTLLELDVAPGIEATVVESHLALPDFQGWQHHVARVKVAEGSRLTHSVLALLPDTEALVHTRRQRLRLEESATYNGSLLSSGGGMLRHEVHAELTEATHYHLTSLSCPRASQHHDVTLQTRHLGENNRVVIRQRNLQADASHAVFQGKFYVAQEAQKTDAYMHCHTLLLGDEARTSTKPELEIYADDVKCSHGAACGGLNAQQLFYLKARGLHEIAARGLLVQGFADEFLADFPVICRAVAVQRVAVWLAGGARAPQALTDFSADWLAHTRANPEHREIVNDPETLLVPDEES